MNRSDTPWTRWFLRPAHVGAFLVALLLFIAGRRFGPAAFLPLMLLAAYHGTAGALHWPDKWAWKQKIAHRYGASSLVEQKRMAVEAIMEWRDQASLRVVRDIDNAVGEFYNMERTLKMMYALAKTKGSVTVKEVDLFAAVPLHYLSLVSAWMTASEESKLWVHHSEVSMSAADHTATHRQRLAKRMLDLPRQFFSIYQLLVQRNAVRQTENGALVDLQTQVDELIRQDDLDRMVEHELAKVRHGVTQAWNSTHRS